MSNKSPDSIINVPKGGGAQTGIGETFSPDLFTGTGNFTVPIALPAGRNSFQPELNLVYSTGNGNGPNGLGWNLSLPNISRKTDKGVPRYRDAEGSDTFVLAVATGCTLGRRTMRVMDFGKFAATIVVTKDGSADRIVSWPGIRGFARKYAYDTRNRWRARLGGCQAMPTHELLQAEPVRLTVDLEKRISRAGVRVNCEVCGEDIINEREVIRNGALLCRPCDSDAYFDRKPFRDRSLSFASPSNGLSYLEMEAMPNGQQG